MNGTNWTPKPTTLRFSEQGRIDVWRVSLLQEAAGQRWTPVLSEEERHRAARFFFEKDRDRYVVTRGVLRTLLGHYLSIAPEAIRFVYNRFGKPSLDNRQNDRQITFNVSHSHHFSLLAFGTAVELGVDLEYLRGDRVEESAKAVFSQAELDWFLRLPAADRERAFLRLWTHKEAIVKAIGCGLSVPLQDIEVALPLTEAVRLLGGIPEMGEVSGWSLYELPVQREYSAALAVRAREIDVQLWEWR